MEQLAPYLNEELPVHGDLETLEILVEDQRVSAGIHSLDYRYTHNIIIDRSFELVCRALIASICSGHPYLYM